MPQRLSALDVQFLLLEKPNVHYHVAGLSILDPSTRPGGRFGGSRTERTSWLRMRCGCTHPTPCEASIAGTSARYMCPPFAVGFYRCGRSSRCQGTKELRSSARG